MPAITNYYAQVGLRIDKSGVKNLQTFLKDIRASLRKVQTSLNSQQANLKVSASLNRVKTLTNINRDLKALSGRTTLRLDKVTLAKAGLASSINEQLKGTKATAQINARLSKESLEAMKAQVRTSLQGLTLSPTIHPRMGRTTIGSGAAGAIAGGVAGRATSHGGNKTKRMNPMGGSRKFNPWYNPMMLGGGLGAFIRYGAFSLPAIGGVLGMNALSNRVSNIQQAGRLLNVAGGTHALGANNAAQLAKIGNRLGFDPTDLAGNYSSFLLAGQGSKLEGQLPQGFETLMDYASVMGANRSSVADQFGRMIQRGVVRTTDLDQLYNAGLPQVYQMMADAVAGGDKGNLLEKMKGGGMKVEDALPKFFQEVRVESNKWLADYYNSVERNRGRLGSATDKWFKDFMGGGTTDALSNFYKTLAQVFNESDGAKTWGATLSAAINSVSLAILSVQQLVKWFTGDKDENNFFTKLFGKADDNKYVAYVKSTFSRIENIIVPLFEDVLVPTVKFFGTVLDGLGGRLIPIAASILDIVEGVTLTLTKGEVGAAYLNQKNLAEAQFRKEARDSGLTGTDADTIVNRRMTKWRQQNSFKDFEASYQSGVDVVASMPWYQRWNAQFYEWWANKVGLTTYDRDEKGTPIRLKNYASGNVWGVSPQGNQTWDEWRESFLKPIFESPDMSWFNPVTNPSGVLPGYMPPLQGLLGEQHSTVDINLNVIHGGSMRVEGSDVLSSEVLSKIQEDLQDAIVDTFNGNDRQWGEVLIQNPSN